MTVTRDQAQMLTTLAYHEPCADCVRCATCRREWCPTVVNRCPGEEPWLMHPTGGFGRHDDEYCYRCTSCPGYFQFYRDDSPPCTVVEKPPHVVAEGKGSE